MECQSAEDLNCTEERGISLLLHRPFSSSCIPVQSKGRSFVCVIPESDSTMAKVLVLLAVLVLQVFRCTGDETSGTPDGMEEWGYLDVREGDSLELRRSQRAKHECGFHKRNKLPKTDECGYGHSLQSEFCRSEKIHRFRLMR